MLYDGVAVEEKYSEKKLEFTSSRIEEILSSMDSELLECEEEKDEELLTFPFAIHSQAIITEKIMKNHAMSFTKIFISNTTPLKSNSCSQSPYFGTEGVLL